MKRHMERKTPVSQETIPGFFCGFFADINISFQLHNLTEFGEFIRYNEKGKTRAKRRGAKSLKVVEGFHAGKRVGR
jgi:hypothetical protein